MKKYILMSVVASLLVASEMPPMPPGFFDTPTKKEVKEEPKKATNTQRSVKVASKMPKECDVVPPMLFMLPPPLQADLDKCTKILYRPSKTKLEASIAKIEKQDINIISIDNLDNFKDVYRVTYSFKLKDSKFKVLNKKEESKSIYTNSSATLYFENAPKALK